MHKLIIVLLSLCVVSGFADDASAQPAATGSCTAAGTTSVFGDVADGDIFCVDTQWLKNRGVTLGCGNGSNYCPTDPVLRSQMALFMNRLGNVLTPIFDKYEFGIANSALDLDVDNIVCISNVYTQTPPTPPANFPRTAVLAADVSAKGDNTGTSSYEYSVQLMYDINQSGTWLQVNGNDQFSSGTASLWTHNTIHGRWPMAAATAYRFAVRIRRVAASTTTADLADYRCNLQVGIFNRDSATTPF